MQTHARLFLIRAARIVRMLELKSSMKRIVWWYFSWPACLVRSRKPWPYELWLTSLAAVWTLWLGHNTSWSHKLGTKPLQRWTFPKMGDMFDPLFSLAEVSGEPLLITIKPLMQVFQDPGISVLYKNNVTVKWSMQWLSLIAYLPSQGAQECRMSNRTAPQEVN